MLDRARTFLKRGHFQIEQIFGWSTSNNKQGLFCPNMSGFTPVYFYLFHQYHHHATASSLVTCKSMGRLNTSTKSTTNHKSTTFIIGSACDIKSLWKFKPLDSAKVWHSSRNLSKKVFIAAQSSGRHAKELKRSIFFSFFFL